MGLRSFFKPFFDPSLTLLWPFFNLETKNQIENNFCNPFHTDQ